MRNDNIFSEKCIVLYCFLKKSRMQDARRRTGFNKTIIARVVLRFKLLKRINHAISGSYVTIGFEAQ